MAMYDWINAFSRSGQLPSSLHGGFQPSAGSLAGMLMQPQPYGNDGMLSTQPYPFMPQSINPGGQVMPDASLKGRQPWRQKMGITQQGDPNAFPNQQLATTQPFQPAGNMNPGGMGWFNQGGMGGQGGMSGYGGYRPMDSDAATTGRYAPMQKGNNRSRKLGYFG